MTISFTKIKHRYFDLAILVKTHDSLVMEQITNLFNSYMEEPSRFENSQTYKEIDSLSKIKQVEIKWI